MGQMQENSWKNEFQNPSSLYRATPFWSWNGKLDRERIRKQIDVFSEMGYGGFHIHARVGLADEYLGEHFMDCVCFCNEYAKEKDMLTWLYDEDKWPSGFGGGRVTQQEQTRARCLLMSQCRYPDGTAITGRKQPSRLTENGTTRLMAAYQVMLDEDGYLVEYSRVDPEAAAANWFAYEILTDPMPWFNLAPYADLLNPETAKSLIRVTHEVYKDHVGQEFGKTIPAVFTDEPQHSMCHALKRASGAEEPVLPYTTGMDEAFRQEMGYGLLDRLPEVLWNDRSLVSKVRWQFHDWVTERFADAYFGVLYDWCEENGLMLTGHVMREEKLQFQTECVGETMRLYSKFHLPGLDMLADRREYATAKQVQSVARQYGRPGVLCEMFGVTNWDFDFKGHKLQADWMAALGTTVRVPHLAWMYMGGESKRDYPAALDEHAPWYSRYRVVEDHLARVSFAMQQGKAHARVAVVHPIESYWFAYGPNDQTGSLRNRIENNFHTLVEWLLFGQIDFDFLAESLLPEQQIRCEDGKLYVGQMCYDTVIVPPLLTVRSTTLQVLQQFQKQGGRVITMGQLPAYVDGETTQAAGLPGEVRIGFEHDALMDLLESSRDVRLCDDSGNMAENLLYQLRTEEDGGWLFVAVGKPASLEGRQTYFRSASSVPHLQIQIRGHYNAELCDTDDGSVRQISSEKRGEWTFVRVPFYRQDSVLLRLVKAEEQTVADQELPVWQMQQYLPSLVDYRLHEPNVLLLDQAQYRLDDGPWQPKEEILRIDDAIRAKTGYQKRTDAFVQPWISGNSNPIEHKVDLRYVVSSQIAVKDVKLCYEGDPAIFWNGKRVNTEQAEYYLDAALHCVALEGICQGENLLELSYPFGVRTNLEACMLLGQFGVNVQGDTATVTELPEKLGFGPLSAQGLPFYGGNVSYLTEITGCGRQTRICVPNICGAMADVRVNEGQLQPVYREPYRVDLGVLTEGTHSMEIIAYGSRINQFGQVHNSCKEENYFGPNSWRSKGEEWSYAYQLRETGIVATPFLENC